MFCIECGKNIEAAVRFCASCGTNQLNSQLLTSTLTNKNRAAKTKQEIIGIALATALALTIIISYQFDRENEKELARLNCQANFRSSLLSNQSGVEIAGEAARCLVDIPK